MAFRSVAVTTNTSTSNHVANVPAGATTGDWLLAFLNIDVSQTVNTPAGWTALANADLTGPDGQTNRCFYRAASGSEPASYTFTTSGSNSGIAVMAAWSGRDTGTAPVAQTTVNTSANTTPITMAATGITASSGDDIAAWYGLDITVGADTWSFSPPSSYTEVSDTSNGDWAACSLTVRDNVSAGATGSLSGTATRTSGSGDAGWAGIVVRMASSGGGGVSGTVSYTNQNDTSAASGTVIVPLLPIMGQACL
jgi:MSHA biogenesis protein MshQ